MSKPKVAFYWCASCGGCEEAVVDLNEVVLDVVAAVDIVFWPVAMDFKVSDVAALEDGELAAAFINGAIRTSEQAEMVELLRRKAGVVVAFGACAWLGGIPGLANLYSRESILEFVYRGSPSTTDGDGVRPLEEFTAPEGTVRLPHFDEDVRTLDQVIDVDYYLPGCPPPPGLIAGAVMALLEGRLPEKGSVLGSSRSLCYECELNETKPEKLTLTEVKRVWEIIPEPDKCLLTQGILCLGPVTRGGCEALCVKAHMPCTGCFGPLDGVQDYGAKGIGAVASLMDVIEEADVEAAVEKIPDPVGTFYRYSLPASLLHRRVGTGDGNGQVAAEPAASTPGGAS
jgi:F420-non-reducing hydrogenase small subunit